MYVETYRGIEPDGGFVRKTQFTVTKKLIEKKCLG